MNVHFCPSALSRCDVCDLLIRTVKLTLLFMKIKTSSAVLIISMLLVGCGKKVSAPIPTSSPAAPVGQTALTLWQNGDKPAAISNFVETDWSSRPLFASNSMLKLSEDQFQALPRAQAQARSSEMMSEVDSLKRLISAVAQAGTDAASKGDTAQARKYLTAVKQCCVSLNSSNSLRIVQLVAQGVQKRADAELAKIGP
jgi:hypothetical protein